ncbi:hypothetical protein RHMOL_Rhmol05G0113000 [Rhododendron molle]|uniref:Uncharacterized protein n=2 Tax=Rhododendron molle TaxID=49168 RepID=A0ACC0NN03_RHOML|nr:hypothetical protein RHMOL_Rhmol05G0113000 [Rhododendron molle]KAI8554636.1 hypothetical protein RHMOL_Rhmol05G0113000 [Rhododendron molle]
MLGNENFYSPKFSILASEYMYCVQEQNKVVSMGILEKAKGICTTHGVNAETIAQLGDPKQAICDAVQKHNIDLLVLSDTKLGKIQRFISVILFRKKRLVGRLNREIETPFLNEKICAFTEIIVLGYGMNAISYLAGTCSVVNHAHVNGTRSHTRIFFYIRVLTLEILLLEKSLAAGVGMNHGMFKRKGGQGHQIVAESRRRMSGRGEVQVLPIFNIPKTMLQVYGHSVYCVNAIENKIHEGFSSATGILTSCNDKNGIRMIWCHHIVPKFNVSFPCGCMQELFQGYYFCQEREDFFQQAKPYKDHLTILRMQKLAKELGVLIPFSFFEEANNAH